MLGVARRRSANKRLLFVLDEFLRQLSCPGKTHLKGKFHCDGDEYAEFRERSGQDNAGYAQTRDPEDRPISPGDEQARCEKSLDKTLADSFPTSDPPSTIPDPESDAQPG